MVEDHIRFFVSQGSRISGYPGCDAAAEYIHDYFKRIGLENVSYQRFNVTIPFDYGATIQLVNRTETGFSIYPMEPNLASPVTVTGLTGPLVYVGKGDLQDLEGKKVKDVILLMDYVSGYNWIRAASLGAKAVIFIEPPDHRFTTVYENLKKHLSGISDRAGQTLSYADMIAFNFPRFYMKYDDFLSLRDIMEKRYPQPIYVNITSKVVWETREARNVMGFVKGESHEDQIIILSAHYDSYSSVLSVAPGANDAVGIAALMEMARLLNMPEFKPRYTVMFIAYAGHHQSLTGAREFFIKNFENGKHTEIADKIILQLSFTLSTLSDTLAVANTGPWFIPSQPHLPADPHKLNPLVNYITGRLIESINAQTGKGYKLVSATEYEDRFWMYFPFYSRMSDAEVLMLNGGAALAIQTVDLGDNEFSPIDDMLQLDRRNLKRNVELATCIAYGVTQSEDLPITGFTIKEFGMSAKGKIVEYNVTSGWYDPVPNALVFAICLGGSRGWVRPIATFADENGDFEFLMLSSTNFRMIAFVINETTGNVEYAPDLGRYRFPHPPLDRTGRLIMGVAYGARHGGYIANPTDLGYYVLLKCGTVVLFDVIYPQSAGVGRKVDIEVLLPDTKVTADRYGKSMWVDTGLTGLSVSTVYLPPDQPFIFVMKTPAEKDVVAALVNSTEKGEVGAYTVRAGEQLMLGSVPLQAATDLLNINTPYLEKLASVGIEDPEVAQHTELAKQFIDKAKQMFSNNSYQRFFAYEISAWSHARQAYLKTRMAYVEVISVMPFFACILIPFVFLFERLILRMETGKKRVFSLTLIFAVTFLAFSFMHPGFVMANNPIMVVISFLILILITPPILMVLSHIYRSLTKIKLEETGLHEVRISRGSAIVMSFQTSVEYLKKTKLRSILTTVTIILVVTGVVLFSSIRSIRVVQPVVLSTTPPYQGVYYGPGPIGETIGEADIKLGDTMTVYLIDYLKGTQEVTIQPTMWLYSSRRDSPYVKMELRHGAYTHGVYSFLAPSSKQTPWWAHLSDGTWFIPGAPNQIILPSRVAEALNASVGDTVIFLNSRRLLVVGIIDSEYLEAVKGMNGEMITPVDYRSPEPMPVDPSQIAIIPIELAMQYRPVNVGQSCGVIASLDVIPANTSVITPVAEELFRDLNKLNLYAGVETGMKLAYKTGFVLTLFGWEMQVIPIIIGSFMILNLMLAGVKEREREILIFSSVGLSPTDISMMFLTEAVTFSIVGTMLGYMISMVIYKLILILHKIAVPVNFSSTNVVFALGINIIITISSAIYPAWKASRLITPSRERTWRIPTKPIDNTWNIPLPFVLTEREAYGLCRYLVEYGNAQKSEVGVFIAEKVTFKDGADSKEVTLDTRLAPYETGVRQTATLKFTRGLQTNRWDTNLILQRTAGEREVWIRVARNFADEIRKQCLIWQTLPREERLKYLKPTETQ